VSRLVDFAGKKAGTEGHQVHTFSPTAEKLLSLGVGAAGNAGGQFKQPNDVIAGRAGSICVADAHDGRASRSR
jgi:hypothetical protein